MGEHRTFNVQRPIFTARSGVAAQVLGIGSLIIWANGIARVPRRVGRVCRHTLFYPKFTGRSHDAVLVVYDDAGNVIEMYEHPGEFKERADSVLI